MTNYSPSALLEAYAQGLLEPPASDAHVAAHRWSWFADLYADPTWGLATAIPDFPPIAADQAANACRAMATQTATAEQWSAIETLSVAGLASAHSRALELVWTALADTCVDARDHLAGREFGGLEVILAALEAILECHPEEDAATYVHQAGTAWARQLESRDRKAA
ncbi:hypothetical protein [Rhodococcus sp. KB6]|uniref:hypothetical protein n=1 Tax=Rhodococcus sp. KB6 TaxID=1752066 RepID=UPI000717E2B4|nr:hypothetical protein [Rhodococcus sp. KB6]